MGDVFDGFGGYGGVVCGLGDDVDSDGVVLFVIGKGKGG